MSWWWAGVAAVQAVGSLVQANSQASQNKSQLAINQYNATMKYNTEMNNISAGLKIAGVNAAMAGAAANLNMQLAAYNANTIRDVSEYNNEIIAQSVGYNNNLIAATTGYNNSLLEEEIGDIWEAAELDVALLEQQRARERGEAVAIQAASGTVIGTGSNADVIIDSMTQEALDTLIIRHGADKQAEQVRREQARNSYMGTLEMQRLLWEGQVQIQKNAYEAEQAARTTLVGGAVQSQNMLMQSMANTAGSLIQAQAGQQSARQGLSANMWNASMSYNQNRSTIQSNMVAGLFNAASTGIAGYYGSKPTTQEPYYPVAQRYPGGPKFQMVPGLTYPGSSLLAGSPTYGSSGK